MFLSVRGIHRVQRSSAAYIHRLLSSEDSVGNHVISLWDLRKWVWKALYEHPSRCPYQGKNVDANS